MIEEKPTVGWGRTLKCTICHLDKPIGEFYPSSVRASTQSGQCKPCTSERSRLHGDANQARGLRRNGQPLKGHSRRKPQAKTVLKNPPPSVSAESLMKAMAGNPSDPHLEAAMQIVAMQQKTVELLLERRRK